MANENDMASGLQPLASAPGPQALVVVMTFLENKSTLFVLLIYCLCDYSCFEIKSMTEKINSVSPNLLNPLLFCYNQEHLMRKS